MSEELGDEDRKVLTDLFASALSDEPESTVTPLSVIAQARREAATESAAESAQRRARRWVRPVSWLAAAAVAAIAVTGVVKLVGSTSSSSNAAASTLYSSADGAAAGTPARPEAAPTGAGSLSEAAGSAAPGSFAASSGEKSVAAGPAGGAAQGAGGSESTAAAASAAVAPSPSAGCPPLPAPALAAVVATLPAGVDPTPHAVSDCGGRPIGAAQFTGGTPAITVTVWLSTTDPTCPTASCLHPGTAGGAWEEDDQHQVNVSIYPPFTDTSGTSAGAGPSPASRIAAAVLAAMR